MTDPTPQPTSGDDLLPRSMFDAANRALAAVTQERDEARRTAEAIEVGASIIGDQRDAYRAEVDTLTQERDALRAVVERLVAERPPVQSRIGKRLTDAGLIDDPDNKPVAVGESGYAEALARRFHETYERLAPAFGYETRKASAVSWDDVPEQNKQLMIAVARELLAVPMTLVVQCGISSDHDLAAVIRRAALAEAP